VPTYQYACTACGHQLEAVQSFADEPLTECPSCEGRLRKLFSAVGIVFKGSGFYRTDSRNGNGKPGEGGKPGAEGKPAGGSAEGKSGAGESGSATAPANGSGTAGAAAGTSGSTGAAKAGSANKQPAGAGS
jgi:putative FmdB family regulatory protein